MTNHVNCAELWMVETENKKKQQPRISYNRYQGFKVGTENQEQIDVANVSSGGIELKIGDRKNNKGLLCVKICQ